MNFVEYADADLMMMGLSNQLAGELRQALTGNDRVSFAVPGGTTPGPVFDALSAVDLDWHRVDVLLTDERWVDDRSDRSNARLVRQRLLVGPASAARLIPYYTGAAQPEDDLDRLNETVAPLLPISAVLLGMGADMHTASLFPGADRLVDGLRADAPPLLPMRAPGAPEPRLTLTAPALSGALSLHILITGLEKRAALERARDLNDPLQAPVCAVLGDATVHWAE